MRCLRQISLFMSLFLAAPLLMGHEGSSARPQIGVALSGGGARGFAYIGVLRWFHEHRIPVDSIAGTSMVGPIEMGADVVITDIGSPLGKRQSLQNLSGVLGQMVSVFMIETSAARLIRACIQNYEW